jgi:hypothetical protein
VSVQASDPYHRPCPRCHHPVALYHSQCKSCGHALLQATNALPAILPSGWEGTPLADGSTQLKRTTWNRINNSGQFASTLILIGAFVTIFSTPGRNRSWQPPPEFAWISMLPFLVIALLAVVYLVWIFLGTERWRLAPGLLEVRKECLGRTWGPRFTHAELVLRVEWRYHHRQRRQFWVLAAQGGGRESVLAVSGAGGAFELQSLGSYLAAQTGWPLRLPPDPSPAAGFWGLF